MRFFLTVNSVILLVTQGAMANGYTYLFNPASMETGQYVDEYLEVKESCPSGDTCAADSKLKYVTSLEGRTGRLEIPINISGNFEISFNVGVANRCSAEHTYALYMSDDNSLVLNISGCYTRVYYPGGNAGLNWLKGVNDFRLIIKDNKLKVSANDSVAVELELSGTLNRVVISKINIGQENIFEIRTRSAYKAPVKCKLNSSQYIGETQPSARVWLHLSYFPTCLQSCFPFFRGRYRSVFTSLLLTLPTLLTFLTGL